MRFPSTACTPWPWATPRLRTAAKLRLPTQTPNRRTRRSTSTVHIRLMENSLAAQGCRIPPWYGVLDRCGAAVKAAQPLPRGSFPRQRPPRRWPPIKLSQHERTKATWPPLKTGAVFFLLASFWANCITRASGTSIASALCSDENESIGQSGVAADGEQGFCT